MRKKTLEISFAIAALILIILIVSSPAFMPEDPDQPIRPLLLEDQSLKEQYLSVIENPDLPSEIRSEKLAALSQAYAGLAEEAKKLQNQGIEHPVLAPLKAYFKDLSDALSAMAIAFENRDSESLIEANIWLNKLDQQFQELKENA